MNKPAVKNVKRTYNYKNIAFALAVILILILSLSTACHRSSEKKKSQEKAESKATVSSQISTSSENTTKLTKNYRYLSADNKKDLCKGSLAVINSDHKFTGTAENLDSVYPYLFNEEGTQIVFASSSEITANKDALENFNKLADDFYNETGLASLLINSACTGNSANDEESSENTQDSDDESATGYVFDLLTYDANSGTYPEFTGTDNYAWVVENCYKYGFIQSDAQNNPGRFRYVGKVNAQIMHSKNFTLEKYNDFLKKYSFEKPFSYTDDDGNNYLLYYVKSEKGDTTKVPIAQQSEGKDYKYDFSGNNTDGYVVCIYVDYTETEEDESSLSQDDTSSESDETTENTDEVL